MKIKTALLFILLVSISGCELIPLSKKTEKSSGYYNYHQYYLSLKTMQAKAIKAEVKTLKNANAAHITDQLKLALVYCLPNSPVYNPYNAKDILNKMNKKNYLIDFTSENFAFFSLLKDALNQQLIVFDKHSLEVKSQHTKISSLKQELSLLKAKLSQLKSIETRLNERG